MKNYFLNRNRTVISIRTGNWVLSDACFAAPAVQWKCGVKSTFPKYVIKCKTCLLMYFSPKKFLISITLSFSVVTQLMGKWAYTALILYWYPLVTPFNMFSTWEHTVLTAASSFLVPNHFSTFNTRGLIMRISKAKCLNDRFRTPRGPRTVIIRLLVLTVSPSGIFTVWFVTICFIFL